MKTIELVWCLDDLLRRVGHHGLTLDERRNLGQHLATEIVADPARLIQSLVAAEALEITIREKDK